MLAIILFLAFSLHGSLRREQRGAEALCNSMATAAVPVAALTMDWALHMAGQYSRLSLKSWESVPSRVVVRDVFGFVSRRGVDTRDAMMVDTAEAGANTLIQEFCGRTDTMEEIRKRVEQHVEQMQHGGIWLNIKIILLNPRAWLRRKNV